MAVDTQCMCNSAREELYAVWMHGEVECGAGKGIRDVQQILGVGIRAVDGKKLGTIPTVLRTLLLGLAIPALIWDRDGRGLHDKITKSLAVRTR